jgi:excinuclease UvrABC ATPase subunit
VVSVDQAAIKGSRRSNPATYTGLLDPIRKAFAKANGPSAA